MPQMSPMWWTSLSIMFMITFMIIMMIIYFYKIYSISKNIKIMNNMKKLNWKW